LNWNSRTRSARGLKGLFSCTQKPGRNMQQQHPATT
jgi:hypothetical protein